MCVSISQGVRMLKFWYCEQYSVMHHSNETSSVVLSHGAVCVVYSSFESVNEILWCDLSNEISSVLLSYGAIYPVCSSNFWDCVENSVAWRFKWNLFGSTFTRYYLFLSILYNEILKFCVTFFILPPLAVQGLMVSYKINQSSGIPV